MTMKIGFRELVKTGCANDIFIFKELVAAADTEMRKKQRYEIIKKGHSPNVEKIPQIE